LVSASVSSPFSVCSWRRIAAICWLRSSTLASASAEMLFSLSSEVWRPVMVTVAASPFAPAPSSSEVRSAVLPFSAAKSSCNADSEDSTSAFAACSSARSCVSSAIWARSWPSAESCPVICRASRNCETMKTDSRKVMTSNSCAMASTKPGQ